ncbi:hypothetical protein [Cryobacterium cryoconiti]|nr:hypothetical protein [Cryobacterium cryoconiti]
MSTLFHLPGSSAAALLSGGGVGFSFSASSPSSVWDASRGPGREESNDVQ